MSEHEIVVTHPETNKKVSKFADIVVYIGDRFGLIIELKYVQAPYIDGYYRNATALPFAKKGDTSSTKYKNMLKRRETLTSLADTIRTKSPDDLRALRFYEKFDEIEQRVSVETREKNAILQVKEYQAAIPKPNTEFVWYAGTIVGIVANLVHTCIDFEEFI